MVAVWDAIQEANDARDPAELQAALQKRELKEHGQRIGREVKEAHKKWLKKNKLDRRRSYGNEATKIASVCPPVLPALGFWMAAPVKVLAGRRHRRTIRRD
jgi:hypothetical protein